MNKKYIRDYEVVTENNKKRLVYTGPFYRPEMPAKALSREKLLLLTGNLIIAGLYIGMGILGEECTRKVYVGIAYALLAVPALYAWVDAVRFLCIRGDLERMHYDGIFMRMFGWAFSTILLGAAEGVGGIVYCFAEPGRSPGDIAFVGLSVLLALTAFWHLRRLVRLKSVITQIQPLVAQIEKT